MKCYGSRGDNYASFKAPYAGKVKSIKLTHVSGGVSCYENSPPSPWGCNVPDFPEFYKPTQFKTVITDNTDKVIFPSNHVEFKYIIPDSHYLTTKALILKSDVPFKVVAEQEFRIWYGEDLGTRWEHDNDPNVLHCVKVDLMYC